MPIKLIDWHNLVINPESSIREALRIIESGRVGIALVLGNDDQLVGMVTDGDVRRAMLTGIDLEASSNEIVNREFVRAPAGSNQHQIIQLIREHAVRQMPVTNARNQIQALYVQSEETVKSFSNPVVIMAGGLGSRLAPLTDTTPKPMLAVTGKPILELLVEQLVASGFENIYISVLHLAEQIQEHFGDGTNFGCNIKYLVEQTPLGTAGCLAMLPSPATKPVLVLNGDLLTNADFASILSDHSSEKFSASQCVYQHKYQVPFGVIHEEDGKVLNITEKPTETWWINAGIYVLSPDLINSIGEPHNLSMLDLLEKGKERIGPIAAVRLMDRWLDIGTISAWRRASNPEQSANSGQEQEQE
jgi:UDP-2,4-diacetamido-2,4,6-trideoxy-beta-L-gulopyranose hydrolase